MKNATITHEIIVIDDIEGDRRLEYYLPWWAEHTQKEKHMLSVTPESLKKELLVATIILSENDEIIGAAGIVGGRNKKNREIIHRDRKVVELGSNVVDLDFRGNGLGKELILKRIEICKINNWFPVSVTTNPLVHKIFESINAVPMDDLEEYVLLRKQLCLFGASCKEKICNSCPLNKKGGWIFE